MDPAEEDWDGHKEGVNEISYGGTFSDAALSLATVQKNSYLRQLAEHRP